MSASTVHPTRATTPPSLRIVYVVQAIASVASNFLLLGIFFYTEHEFHWSLLNNLLLAAAQGAVYVLGALLAGPLATRLGRRRGLIILHIITAFLAAAALLSIHHPPIVAIVLITYVVFVAANWPLLESLVSHSPGTYSPDALSRQLALYNLTWSIVGAVTVALSGTVIQFAPKGVFVIPLLCHATCVLLLWLNPAVEPPTHADHDVPPPSPEPELARASALALWLSRICLPATYVIVYSLMAMMPSLPLLAPFAPATKTLLGSVWLVARFFAFVLLGATAFWHTRPRLLVLAALVTLLAFPAVTIRLAAIFLVPNHVELTWMIAWQVLLGLSMGLIYAASLYFGMVLSRGSTEQGGYHEALIGLGSALGPSAALIAQTFRPGNVSYSVAAVTTILALSVAGALLALFALRSD